ncbi:NAD(P)/FAD-dependent oxidoreductase [Deinococcus hohokamensis]|uniref:Ferredoxin--NADP reductase n=1 Tax=Deinococcus hohokamensis TaxID=309883 RepID=A0ABV9I404_9DEIO
MPEQADILVVGGGPAGLHAAFYAAWRGLRVLLLEARPELGGQAQALYPDKAVYDVPGLPRQNASALIGALVAQLAGLPVEVRTGTVARTLRPAGKGWQVEAEDGRLFSAGSVILAAGLGALRPREARVPGAEAHPDVRTELPEPASLAGRPVLVVGGVPQATRAALELAQAGARVTLTHRRAGFRGRLSELEALDQAQQRGQLQVLAPATLDRLSAEGAALTVDGAAHQVPAETVLLLGGYLPDLGPVLDWPLDWDGEYVPDGPGGQTALPGVFVAGDVARSGGDFKLISVAFAQAAVAANHAVHHVRPDLKVRPGHSSEKRL